MGNPTTVAIPVVMTEEIKLSRIANNAPRDPIDFQKCPLVRSSMGANTTHVVAVRKRMKTDPVTAEKTMFSARCFFALIIVREEEGMAALTTSIRPLRVS